jgi:hypothetical protein
MRFECEEAIESLKKSVEVIFLFDSNLKMTRCTLSLLLTKKKLPLAENIPLNYSWERV